MRPAAFSEPVTSLASWPQLGGSASHNPISPVTNLPTQFHLDRQENIRWSQPIGDFAFSSPVVSGGKVLIGTNNAIGRDPQSPGSIDRACLQCFDERTGEFLWQYSSPKMEQGRRHDWPSIGICSTPVIEGDRVWFATNRCEIVCLDLNGHRDNEDDGEPEASAPGETANDARSQRADVVWKFDLFNTLGVRPLNATCVTPTIAGDLLLINSSNDVDESYQKLAAPEAPAFLAFHKATGQLVWSDKTPNPNILGNGCSMGAPAVAQIDGVWQAIFAGYDGWLYAFDLKAIHHGQTELLWKFDVNPKEEKFSLGSVFGGGAVRGMAVTPVVFDNKVFAAVGRNPERGEGSGRLWCIDATKRGDLSSELVYNKAAPEVVIPHKRVQACERDKGDFTRPNPNSGVVWVYTTDDLNKNRKIEFEEQMHLSNSLPAIHDGLLLTTDLSGLVHCLDATTGELLWTHDQLATCWSGPLLADGKAWVIDEDGDLSIFALSRQKQLLAEIAMNSPGYTNFAAANQTLYVATKTQLLAIGSGVFPKPNGVTAKLPGGLEIELVGVTPNAAPTSEGWRADGAPLESIGHWPRGATFSKDGDRFTITTDRTSKLPPDPLARDLLFESRGLRSHPSWVILNQKGWTPFESVNADETIRRRLSYLPKESGQPLTVEMALTDSPWGPWQRIDKSGKRINTIETFEPDQKLYEEIQIVRLSASRDTDSSDKPLHLVLVEPATHVDYQSGVFDIEVRFVDKNGKLWKTFASPSPSKDGRRLVTWATGGPVPLESLAYAEFRLRPYRHFITFKNVPLDRTPGALVAVEHRSLPLPPTHAPDPRFTAQVPGGIEIELLRMVRNDLSEDQSWTPDGKPSPGRLDWPQRSHYKVRPDGNGYSSSDEGPGSDRAWDLVYEVRSSGSKPFASVDLIGDGSVSSSQFSPAIGPRLVTVIPKAPESLTAFQLRVGTEPWGEWIQVGADGEILNPEAIRTATDAPDRLVTHMRAGLDAENLDRSWLQWRTPQNHAQHYQMEVRAIDDDGKVTESNSSTHSVADRTHIGITKYFNLPLDRLARFEYRLRPYRHLVTFDQICTDPAKPTEVRVDVSPIVYLEVFPSPEAAVNPTRPMVAKLPGGLEVELVGVTKNFAPAKEGWKPNGSPIGEVADWQATRVFRRVGDSTVFDSKGTSHPDARDYLFEMRGFRSPPSYETNLNDTTSWNEPEYAEPYRTRLSMLLKESNDAKKFSVKITDDPWGPYQQVGPDGALLNELNLTELEKKYYDKIRVEHCGPDPANPGEGELSLQFQESFILDEKDWGYDFEVRAIGLDGQPLKDAYPWNSSRILNRTTLQYLTSDHLPADKIARWEYRLRPYRHFITFENVSFEPGKQTEPKVSVESIAVADPPKKFIAQVPGGIEVELLGTIRELKSRDRLSLAPDGSPLPSLKPYLQHHPGDAFTNLKRGLRDFQDQIQYQVRGGDSATVDVRGPAQFGHHASHKDADGNPIEVLMGGGSLPKDPMTFTAKVADEPWGEWIHVSPTGQILNPEATQERHAAYYDKITIGHAGEHKERTTYSELKLNFPNGFFDSCRFHLRIVPKEGQKLGDEHSMHYQPDSFRQTFNLPPDQVERFEFRLRPYRHLVKFENVSLDPEKPTEPKISVEPIPVFQAVGKDSGEAEAQLQPRIDLIGLTYDSVPKIETWQTNGQPLPAPEWVQQLPKLYGDDKSKPAPLYLFEVHGLRAKPSFRHRYQPAVVSGDDELPEGRPYRMAVLYEDLKPEERNQFIIWGEHPAVRMTDEPWGPWRAITKEGQFAEPIDPNTLYREGYDMVTLRGFRPLTKKPNDPEPAPDAVRTGLVLKHPMDYDSLYAIEIEAVPSTAGPQLINVFTSRPVQRFRNEAEDRWDIESEWPVDPTKIDHLRYRIRPYRHRFEFQEVAYKQYERPATSAPFKVIHTRLEHDLPKPLDVSRVQATLPGGLELELLGVTPFRDPLKESWAPDGKKFDPAPDWVSRLKLEPLPPGGMSDLTHEDYQDFIVRARGFSPEQIAQLPFLEKFEAGDSTIGRMQVLTYDQQVQRLRIGLPGDWGPYQVLRVDPKVPPKAKAVEVPAEVPAPFRKIYDSIQPMIEEGQARGFAAFDQFPFGEVNLNQGQNKGQHTRVVWKGQPANPDLKYTTLEAVLVDVAGKRHASTGTTNVQDGPSQWDVDLFDVAFDQVSHVEYRLRPYQHVVTFNNVALKPGVACGPNVVVESPPSPPPYVAKPARPQRPIEAYEKVGVHCQKFHEEVPQGLARERMGPTLETSGHESDDGPLVLGLRVAKDPNWRIGGQVRVELTVRNQSKKEVLFTHTGRSDNGLSIVAIDQNGREHHAYIAQFDSLLVFLPKMLPPFHTTTVKSFLLRFDSEKRDVSDPGVAAFHLPPGDYKLQCRWNDARPEVAHEGEWTGELTSVAHAFHLAAADEPPGQPPGPKYPTASSELIRKLSAPDQSERDQAAAQLKTLFKRSAKEPWQAKIDAIAKDTPRAEVFAKLSIDERQDLYAAINTTEDYRLDDTWMVRITFTGDLQKSVAIELIELLHRPWVDPPANFSGIWVTYYVNGVKAHEIDYRNGKYHGRHRSYHSNGKLLVQQHYTDHVANGEDTGYYSSGQLMYRGLYENDKQVGTWIHYNEDGSERSRSEHPQPTKPLADAASLIRLQVVDAQTNQPVTDAEVVVRQTISTWQPKTPKGPLYLSYGIPESLLELMSDGDGRFEFTVPAAMRDWQSDLQISVRHPDYVIEQSFGSWQVTPEMATDPALLTKKLFESGLIKLKRGNEISGQIQSPDGKPAIGVKLYAAWQMPQYLNMPPHAVTDSEGRYRFRIVKETDHDRVFVIPLDAVAVSFPLSKKFGEQPLIQLERGTVISGRVLDRDGKPLRGVVVQANGSDSVYDGFPNPMARLATDAEGHYTLPPQKLPVDVRVSPHGWRGGWSFSGNVLSTEDVYLPVLARGKDERAETREQSQSEKTPDDDASGSMPLTLDFHPAEAVTLTARVYNEKGLPETDSDIAIFGTAPDPQRTPEQIGPHWRGSFHAVPNEPGLHRVKVPKGLLDATLVHSEIPTLPAQPWSRAVREGEKSEGPRTNAAWAELDRDDDSIIVGQSRSPLQNTDR